MKWTHAPLMILLLLASLAARAAPLSVHAFLDRDHARMGDSVTLNVKIDGSTSVPAPDLDALKQDFQVLGTSRSSTLSYANGKRTASTLWAVVLKPLHEGTLTVPALDVDGRRTQPLTLTVTAASPRGQGHAGDPVFVTVTPSTLTPYIGQQLDLTVRLFYAPDLTDGSLETPQADGLSVRQMGQDLHYQTQRDGRTYHVVERHFALIPQKSGRIDLPGIGFSGRALGMGGMGGFMSFGQPVNARSPALTLHVQPPPKDMRGSSWVPARALELSMDGLPGAGQSVQVGEPLTLTLRERATGLPFESLPALSLPDVQGAQVYPDKSQDSTGHDGPWLVGRRQRKFALVPQQAGTLRIPEITLRWWDVVHQRAETARIPAHTIQVVAAPAGAGAGTGPAAAATAATGPTVAAAAPADARPASAPAVAGRWRWIALAAMGLWLLTAAALAWVLWRGRRRPARAAVGPAGSESESARRSRHAFLAAVRSGRVDLASAALLRWARAQHPDIRHLGALAEALDDEAQVAMIAALQRARFADGGGAMPPADALVGAFRHGLRWRRLAPAAAASLPPLYPTR